MDLTATALERRPPLHHLAVAAALLVLVAAGGMLRDEATRGRHSPPTVDERSYVRLARDLRQTGTYGDGTLEHPFHWAPGTPLLFAATEAITSPAERGGRMPEAALDAQSAVSTATIVAAFAVAAMLGGTIAGLAAAAAVAVYPPMVDTSGVLVSEPLGGLTLLLAVLALVWAWRGPPARFLLAGSALGVACLTRADLVAPALLLAPAVAVLSWRAGRARAGRLGAAALVGAFLLVVGPWVAYASHRMGTFVPITDGGASTLWVATYLPGHGTIYGAKHALAAEVRHVDPQLRHQPAFRITSEQVFDAIAARHPHLSRDGAIRAELARNRRDIARHPVAYLKLEATKLWRMWGSYYHAIPDRHRRAAVVWAHRALVLLALGGLIAGLVARRRPELALVVALLVAATMVNAIFVAEPRHAARLMPALVAAGAAGWALAVARRRPIGRQSGARTPAGKPVRNC